MLRLAANLSFLFQDTGFLDRFDAAARHGFRGVEFLFPYDWPAKSVAEALERSGVAMALFNLPAGDWEAGDRGLAAIPGREREFCQSVDIALPYIETLRPAAVHILAGIPPGGTDLAAVRDTYLGNLIYAAAVLPDNLTLTIEAINHRDMPGYYLHTVEQAAEILEAVNQPRLRLQFDLYHAQIAGGDLIRRLEAYFPRVAHIQVAGNPGRHEPSVGEIAYPAIFERLEELGYAGWIGCEYRPRRTTAEGLAWAERFGIRARPR